MLTILQGEVQPGQETQEGHSEHGNEDMEIRKRGYKEDIIQYEQPKELDPHKEQANRDPNANSNFSHRSKVEQTGVRRITSESWVEKGGVRGVGEGDFIYFIFTYFCLLPCEKEHSRSLT